MWAQNAGRDLDGPDRGDQHRRAGSVGNKAGLFAVASAILLLVACTPGAREEENAPATEEPATENAVETTADEVATGFLEAFGAFDAERAITYLAEDAGISDLIGSVGAGGVEGTQEEFRILVSLLEAEGYRQMLDSCEEMGSLASGTGVRCGFDFHLFGSDRIGLGPFGGSYFDVYVRDGEVVRASMSWETEKFSPQVWEPFAEWVSTAHPDDAALMYQDQTRSGVRIAEESIPLWKRHVRGYVKQVRQETEGP